MSYKVVFVTGDYSARQREANRLKATFYLEGHANSAESNAVDYAMCVVAQRHSKKSYAIATRLAREMTAAFDVDGNIVGGPGVRVGGRGDGNLNKTDMPAVLIEPGFANNPKQAALLESEEGIDELAEILCATIVEEFPHGGLIALSIGHKGKTSAPKDRGAAWVGKRFKTEAEYVEEYLKRLQMRLVQAVANDSPRLEDREASEQKKEEPAPRPAPPPNPKPPHKFRTRMGAATGLHENATLSSPVTQWLQPGSEVGAYDRKPINEETPENPTIARGGWIYVVVPAGVHTTTELGGWAHTSSLIEVPRERSDT